MPVTYSEKDCIDALRDAADELGESPTAEQYIELDISPSYSVFYDKFGGWNEAKEAAGIEQYSTGRSISHKPEIVEISKEEWVSLTPSQRASVRRAAPLQRIKVEQGCQRCGYDKHPSALEFHHTLPEGKDFNVIKYARGNVNWKETKDELRKCEVLCSNCHGIEESEWW
jgi:hypothetical protein